MRVVTTGAKVHAVRSLVHHIPCDDCHNDNDNLKRVNILEDCAEHRNLGQTRDRPFCRYAKHELIGSCAKDTAVDVLG